MTNVQEAINMFYNSTYDAVVAYVLISGSKCVVFFVAPEETLIMWFNGDVCTAHRDCTTMQARATYRQTVTKGYMLIDNELVMGTEWTSSN